MLLTGCGVSALATHSGAMAAPPVIIRASVSTLGAEGNNSSNSPALSANGRFVAFTSIASNLVSGDNNDSADVFVHDLGTGVTRRVSLTSSRTEGNSASFEPALSANGQIIAFSSLSTNLAAEDNNDTYDVFLRDLKTGITQRISQNRRGIEGNSSSFSSSISANGRSLAFESVASNLVEGDHNDTYDVFVRR
ncbi:MAG: TolB family protein [Methylosarcina sp.]